MADIITIGYFVSLSALGPLKIYEYINNRIEDKSAIYEVDVQQRHPYPIFGEPTRYLAFDTSGDGEIDEIKEYSGCAIGVSCRSFLPSSRSVKYHEEDPEFMRIMDEYFTP
jgi:hypothetical protein